MSKDKILGEKYKIGDQIAQGGFSTVYYCVDLHTKDRYAVKVLRKSRIKQLQMEEAFEREASALRALNYSPYVTNVVDILQSTRNYYVIMDLADCGTLLQTIVRGNLGAMAARKYFRQLLQGLQDIHNSNVVHRDIKPDNLLLDSWRDLKISDFGFAACSPPDRILTRQCGTPQYVAPEVVQDVEGTTKGYRGRQADIWSAGVTLYVMLYRTLPFAASTTEKLFEKIKSGKYETPPSPNVSPAALHLLSVMLRVDPDSRWPIDKLMLHPWVLGRNNLPKTLMKRTRGASKILSGSSGGNSIMSPGSLTASCSTNNAFLQTSPHPGNVILSESFQLLSTESFMAVPSPEHEQVEDLFLQMKENNVAPSLSCPDFRTLFRNELSEFSGQKRSEQRKGPLQKCESPHVHAQVPEGSPTHTASGPATRENSTVSQPAASHTPPLHRPTPSPSRSDSRGITPQGGEALRPEDEINRFKKKSFMRRFGFIHVKIAINFFCVCVVVLLVGCLRVLFDIDISKLRLPGSLRESIEQLLEPPKKKRKSSCPTGVDPTSLCKTPRRKMPRNFSNSQSLFELEDTSDMVVDGPRGKLHNSDGDREAVMGSSRRSQGMHSSETNRDALSNKSGELRHRQKKN